MFFADSDNNGDRGTNCEKNPNRVRLHGGLREFRSISLDSEKVTIDYIGTLESCPVVDGDYEPVEDAYFSPYTCKTEGKARFFRAR